jgi:hypothetical protein
MATLEAVVLIEDFQERMIGIAVDPTVVLCEGTRARPRLCA